MARLSWLHLSDLHLGTQGSRLLRPEYRETFERDLRRLHERSGPWDLVLISGDLTQKGSPREFELLNSTLLNSLWDYLHSLGSNPCLLAVPGFHDFEGGRMSPVIPDGSTEAQKAPKRRRPDPVGTLIRGGFDSFDQWFSSWRLQHAAPAMQAFRAGQLPGDFSSTVTTDGLKLGVIGLNSVFNGFNSIFQTHPSAPPGSGHEHLVAKLKAVLDKPLRKWSLQHDLLLLLTHASPSMLQPGSLDELHEKLSGPGRPFLHLCGSRDNEGWVSASRVAGGPHVLHAPSLFGDVGGDLHKWGYYVGQVNLAGRSSGLRIFPRIASTTGGLITLGPDPLSPSPEEGLEFPLAAPIGEPPSQKPAAPIPAPQPGPSIPPVPASLPRGLKLRRVLSTGSNTVSKLAWAPDGDVLGIGLSRGDITYWKPDEQAPRWTAAAHVSGLVDFCFSPDGQTLASRSRHNIRLWENDGTRIPSPIGGQGTTLAWSSSDLLAAEVGGSLELWDMRTLKLAAEVGGSLGLWDMRTLKQVRALSLPSATSLIPCLAWSPDGQILACWSKGAARLIYWKIKTEPSGKVSFSVPRSGFQGVIRHIAWMPGSSWLALANQDGSILLGGIYHSNGLIKLEGHTDAVTGVSFSSDGRLLASKSLDGTVRLWRTDTWEEVARIEEPGTSPGLAGPVFSPEKHVLATLGPQGCDVRLWDLDIATLLQSKPESTTVHELSAKVVLVGEGRVGKSCLALRMVQDRYEEMDSTHGMRFWTMPAEGLAPGSSLANTRREVIFWDMGGQSEYQLVHQLFLRDSDVALMVMEPGRGEHALEEMEGWNQRLLAQSGSRNIRKLLVGAKVDGAESPVNLPAIERFVERRQLASYVSTSAKTGKGIAELKAALIQAIDWSSIEKVSRPELFQRLRQHIQRLREAKRVVLTFAELESELRGELGSGFDPDALRAVVSQLVRQGLVADSRMADGTRVLILEVEQVERYAGSLILAARDNPHGVPGLDVANVLHPAMRFPRIPPEQRLRRDQELPILECVIELLLEHGLCLRHEGLLIFPSLFRPTQSEQGADFSHAISLHYDFSGPIDNIYASLVTSLAISRRFGQVRLWENRAEFGRPGQDASGLRRVKPEGQSARGHARLDLYFDTGTPSTTRELFVSLIEEHLRARGVALLERLTITCVCGRVFAEDIVRDRLKVGGTDIGCPVCEHRTPLTLGAQQARERNPELARQVHALSSDIQEQISDDIMALKVRMTEIPQVTPPRDTRIRILHLSDLHVDASTDPLTLFEPLAADLRDRLEGPGVDRLDYLVISGDITNRATPAEFQKAREFVSALIKEFGLSAERCILVPGNHDLDWDTEVYTRKKKRQVDVTQLAPGTYKEDGDGYYLREEAKYPERFKNFSQHFYHPLTQKEYPLAPEEQCIPFFFSESCLQFLAMNSAWEIDEYFTERSSISAGALARGLEAVNRMRGELASGAPLLRIAVWHHPITGNEKIQADAFMGRLLQADVRLCLHGHVHEDRADLVNYLHAERRLHVVGAGSFGAPTHHRPEAVPRLYNLLEVERDLRRIRVHTRSLRRQGGAWEGWAIWPGERSGEKRTYYDVTLP